jgi:hypothetical protein
VRRPGWLVTSLGLFLLALMAGTLALLGFGYIEQTKKVDDVEAENAHILDDHRAIGKKFSEQSKLLESAIRSSYRQGFLAGQRVRGVPAPLQPLTRYAADGMLLPRRLPARLASRRIRVATHPDGYVVRWPSLALFASRTDPLSVWTRQALGGVRRGERVGGRTVTRLTGPNGVIYAWRERTTTYAVVALPSFDPAGRALIASMR